MQSLEEHKRVHYVVQTIPLKVFERNGTLLSVKKAKLDRLS